MYSLIPNLEKALSSDVATRTACNTVSHSDTLVSSYVIGFASKSTTGRGLFDHSQRQLRLVIMSSCLTVNNSGHLAVQ